MGRQVYLTRLAFGRSAFEAPNVEEVPFPIANQHTGRDFDCANDRSDGRIQLYDSRGHPVNPQSRKHARRLREAQNNVLAAIGAVESKWVARRGATGTDSGSWVELRETNASETIWTFVKFVQLPIGWMFDILKTRFSLVQIPASDLSFTRHIAEELRSGLRLVLRAMPSYLINADFLESILLCKPMHRLIDTVLWLSHCSRQDLKESSLGSIVHMLTALLCNPLQYHSSIAQLKRASGILPSSEAWRPGSRMSPYPSFRSLRGFLLSPIIIELIVYGMSMSLFRHLHSMPRAVIGSNIIQPTNSATCHADPEERKGVLPDPVLPLRFPVLSRALGFLGWTYSYTRQTISYTSSEQAANSIFNPRMGLSSAQGLSDGGPMQVAVESTAALAQDTVPVQHIEEILEAHFASAQSPMPSARANIDNDLPSNFEPTVRIMSRDGERGHVEVEIQLPSEMLVSHEALTIQREVLNRDASLSILPHRVSALSRGPAKLLASIVHQFLLAEVAKLPYRLMYTNFNILYYTHTPTMHANQALVRSPLHSVDFWKRTIQDLRPSSVLHVLGNLALCTALEYAIYAGLWGCHLAFTIWKGKRTYCWGRL